MIRVGGVSLDERIEGQLGRRGHQRHRRSDKGGAPQAAHQRADGAGRRGDGEGTAQHPLFCQHPAQPGGDGRTGDGPRPQGSQHQAELEGRGVTSPQLESDPQGEKAHGRPQQAHGRGRHPHSSRGQLGSLLHRGRADVSHRHRSQAKAVEGGHCEQDHGHRHRPGGTPQLGGEHGRHPAYRGGQGRKHRQLGVGGHQRIVRGDHGREIGALGHLVALAHDQHGERLGKKQHRVDVGDHQQRGYRPGRARADHDPPGTASGPVDGGAHEGSDDRERRQGQQQIQHHPPAGGFVVERKEQRSGQRDGHRAVARG